MTPERWRRIRDLFDEAAELPVGERETLVSSCADADVRGEVEAMLGAMTTSDHIADVVATTASEMLDHSRTGQRLGPYRLIRELGAGGMGCVYLAERDDDQYRTEVAVKLLQRGFGTAAAVARFRDERQILATLEHPGIVRLLDGGTDRGLPYIVMERVEGVSITRYADEHSLSVVTRLELFLRVCDALQFAHQRMVVHRDIKPSNILVDTSGAPKLLDFGIAKLLDEQAVREAHTGTGLALFTPEYASPEQVRAQPVSAATDVYSMGAVLYHMLAGVPPHRITGDAVETLRVICEVDPPAASTVAPADRRRAIAGDLDNITAKALAKAPGSRYSSIEQLSEDLRRHLDGLPVSARANTWSYRAGRFVRRNRTGVVVATAISLALVAAAGISIDQARRARVAAAEARARADLLVLSQADELRERDPTAALAWLKQYPTTARWDRARDIVAEASARGVARHVLDHPRAVEEDAFGADGTRLATVQTDGVLRMYDVERHVVLAERTDRTLDEIELSPDGSRLFATTTDHGLRVYDTATWQVLSTLAFDSRVVSLAVSRDGRVAVALASHHVELWDGAAGAPRRLGEQRDLSTVAFSPDGRTLASSGLDRRVVLWDVSPDATTAPRVFDAPTGISTVAFSPDGRFIAGTGWSIEVWNVATGERATLDRPLWRLSPSLAFVEGNRVALADDSGDVHVWSPASGDIQTLRGHRVGLGMRAISASADGRLLVTRSESDVRVWPVPPARRVARLRGTATDTPVISPDCRYVASGASSGAITVWDTTTDELHTLEGHPNWINGLVFTRDGKQLLSTDQTSIRSWDLDTMQGRTLRTTTSGRLKSVRALSDGHIAVIDRDEILVFGDDGATPTCRVPGTHYRISADARTVAVHLEGVIKLVELPACHVREIARSDEATAIALSPDGSQVAMVGGSSGHTALFDVARSTTRELDGREASGYLAYSSDGALVAAAGYYGTVRVWDAATGKVRRTFLGHRGSVGRVKFSPDDRRLASIDAVGAIRVWTIDGDDFEVHRGHTSNVMGVAFCARGDYMVTSGFDGTLRMWPTTPAHPRPSDAAGLRAWLDTVTTARADKEGRIGSPE